MIIAKTIPVVESLKEHTDKLIEREEELKELYGEKINKILPDKVTSDFWDLLYICCFYHDFGKVFTPFQNDMKKHLKESQEKTKYKDNIPHSYLSPAFLNKKDITNKYGDDMYNILIQAIAYHHERDKMPYECESVIRDIIKNDLEDRKELINKEMNLNISKLNNMYINNIKNRIKEGDKDYKIYVLLKGLLHRIDHSASAGVEIELDDGSKIDEFSENFILYIRKSSLNKLQEFAKLNKDKNIVAVASTGTGKTEAALIWIDDDKAFFTLPLRVSLNAMYKRIIEDIKFKNIGLLHSTSLDFFASEGFEDSYERYAQSRQLSNKLILSTIDQIFAFPFKYRGYEKIYATLSYSKVVIDEIQAYTPEIAAAILTGLKMIYNIGGKFMIMTATLPKIYKTYLENSKIPFEKIYYPMDKKRHRIKIKERVILDDIDEIIEKGRSYKVIVIVNTVKLAVNIYSSIIQKKFDKVKLLHSMFIQKDRLGKEKDILDFTKTKENGIWVTTQIVEASLDVDFDYLFTEMSTLDSLFQRMGRCYRKRDYIKEEPNVFIYTKDVTGIKCIYDEEIFQNSINAIKNFDMKILDEDTKIKLVDKVYSVENLKGTKYYVKFNNTLNILYNISDYDHNKAEVQNILRKIYNIKAIPQEIYDKNILIFDEYKKCKNKRDKFDKLLEINKLTVDINYFRVKSVLTPINGIEDIYKLNYKYDNEIGVHLGEEMSNSI